MLKGDNIVNSKMLLICSFKEVNGVIFLYFNSIILIFVYEFIWYVKK